MNSINTQGFTREISVERAMLMIPMNVVMMGRVSGAPHPKALRSAIQATQKKHPLLTARVELKADGTAWFVGEDIQPELTLTKRDHLTHWIAVAKDQSKQPFDFSAGPLVRYVILEDELGFDLLVCAHHIICDGMSLSYLIRDILTFATSSDPTEITPSIPVEINQQTATSPPRLKPIPKLVIALFNRIWRQKEISFTLEDQIKLGDTFWNQNKNTRLIAWELTTEQTENLANRSRREGVTVNTALWAAVLLAQAEVQGAKEPFRNRAGMAVSVRDKMKVPGGETVGFYASSLTTRLKADTTLAFWELARRFQKIITKTMKKTNPFKMMVSNLIDNTLIDSLYFHKYGLLTDSNLSKKLLKMMNWDKLNYGFSITNVGKVNLPKTYGDLSLENVFGPVFYSDVNEKTVGVTTVAGTLTFSMTFNEDHLSVSDADRIKTSTTRYLMDAVAQS